MKRITRIDPVKPSENRKLRVGAYCRVSTASDEQLESLEAQREHYDSFIKEHAEWEFAGLYYDEGITGTKKEVRADLMRMLEDCRSGKIDFILTKSISRFSRNKIDCLSMVRELLGLGIGIFFEKENINTKTMNDEFLLTVLSSVAEMESQSISSNEKWGIQKRMEEGTYKQGMAPYGYKKENGRLVIDEEQAETVRYVFARALQGAGSYLLAKELNDKETPAPKGGKWNPSSINQILCNERYAGNCLYGKTYTDSTYKRHKNRGESDRVYIENHHDPIVSMDDFEKVQKLRSKKCTCRNIEAGAEKYGNRYLFTHKLKCGNCGCYLKHKIIKCRASGAYDAWACPGHINEKENCSLKSINQAAVENAFTTMLNKLIISRKQLLDPFMKSLKGTSFGDINSRLAEIETSLDQNTSKNHLLSELASDGVLDAQHFLNAQSNLKAERTALATEKEMLTLRMEEDGRGNSEAMKLKKIIERLEVSDQFDEKLFSAIVEEAVVNERISISFKLKCGLRLTEKMEIL